MFPKMSNHSYTEQLILRSLTHSAFTFSVETLETIFKPLNMPKTLRFRNKNVSETHIAEFIQSFYSRL